MKLPQNVYDAKNVNYLAYVVLTNRESSSIFAPFTSRESSTVFVP